MAGPRMQWFVSFHKPFIKPQVPFLQPIQAGRALATEQLDMPGDDTGDHISHLNPYVSELTVKYWIWKNADRSRCDYWGLMHYRRYFCRYPYPSALFRKKSIYDYPIDQKVMDRVVTPDLYELLLQRLQTADVVLVRPMEGYKKRGKTKSIEQIYKEKHIPAHWDTMIEVIREQFPDYAGSLPFFQQGRMSFLNMMVAPWAVWDDYLSFLFGVLFEVDRRISHGDDPYQNRVLAFLSERLLPFYIHHKGLNAAYFPIAYFH